MRRFLVHALPNIRTAPNRQTFTRAKIHPVDTSLSVQTMISKGRGPMASPVDYGNLLESFVVNQIAPTVPGRARRLPRPDRTRRPGPRTPPRARHAAPYPGSNAVLVPMAFIGHVR